MEWQFRNDSPIYTQLTQRLTQAIVAGEFRPAERLPLGARACGGGGRQSQHGAACARRP